ncbi:ethanolamine ammonia-lyase subunit EutB [Escherichia coli]
MAWRGTTIRSSSIPWWALSGRIPHNDRQIIRAGLEDHFMGKLSGISMGCDCCYTNHADADQNLNENLMILLATAGCNYIMGMPLGDDIMLNYQTTAFHDTATVRQLLNLRPSPEFERWLETMGIMANGRLTPNGRAIRHCSFDDAGMTHDGSKAD